MNGTSLAASARRLFRFSRGLLLLVVVVASPHVGLAEPTGSLVGKIGGGEGAARATAVAAIDRKTGKRHPGSLDPGTGEFSIRELPLEASYDCLLSFGEARLEGVNLHVPRSDYEEEQPLSEEDIATVTAKARRMNKFEDVVEIKTVQGNIQHAAVLLNKLRTRPFFGSKPGEVIWRCELWRFERPEETWVKVQEELAVVLYRERISAAAFKRKSHTFDPRLGGLRLTKRRPKLDIGEIEPPSTTKGIHFRQATGESAEKPKPPAGVKADGR